MASPASVTPNPNQNPDTPSPARRGFAATPAVDSSSSRNAPTFDWRSAGRWRQDHEQVSCRFKAVNHLLFCFFCAALSYVTVMVTGPLPPLIQPLQMATSP